MLVERTHYYAKPGRAAEVLATRGQASEVRVSLGLPHGRILAKVDPVGDGPDVTWECAFTDAAAHAHDLAVRDRSPAFAAASVNAHSQVTSGPSLAGSTLARMRPWRRPRETLTWEAWRRVARTSAARPGLA